MISVRRPSTQCYQEIDLKIIARPPFGMTSFSPNAPSFFTIGAPPRWVSQVYLVPYF
jgi:hypothetical protein